MGGRVDSSLHFGQQNFFFTDAYTGSSVSGDTNDYVVYQNRKGTILIAQFSANGNTGRYVSKSGDYNTIVVARGTYTYVTPNKLIDLDL